MVKLNCNTKPQTFHKTGGTFFVGENLVTDLISVKIIAGLVATQNVCLISLKAR